MIPRRWLISFFAVAYLLCAVVQVAKAQDIAERPPVTNKEIVNGGTTTPMKESLCRRMKLSHPSTGRDRTVNNC
jgi:hypothetical protein